MLNKIKNTSFLLIFLIFVFLISNYYFSEKNIILTNKSRSSYSWAKTLNVKDLPILINDTDNAIIYKNDLEEFKKKRKKRIWEKLISDENG
tara:strand:- start:80 stop:352 length:273 start_codon:yes stop_codon:yes gene_type:complete